MNSDVAKQRGWRWTLRRISRGGPAEAGWRVLHMATVTRWNRSEVPSRVELLTSTQSPLGTPAPNFSTKAISAAVEQAEKIMAGTITVLGVARHDLQSPDWLSDAGASQAMGADLDGSSPNISLKHVWELSRLAPIVDLCLAYSATGDARYAKRAVDLLDGWTQVLRDKSSVLWGSGVEAALRIIAIGRIIRLLSNDPEAAARLRAHADLAWTVDRHLDRLARFPSRFSSANNHALVEAAGLVVGSVVFNPTGKATGWHALGLKRLQHQLDAQLDAAGVSKEKATDYHGFITAVVAMTVAAYDTAQRERPAQLVTALERMHGGVVALVQRGSLRIGDGDDSTVFGSDPRPPLLHALDLSSAVLGIDPTRADDQSLAALMLRAEAPPRSATHHADPVVPTDALLASSSWIATLRSASAVATIRTGSIGYLAVAAHGHADLTSIQLTVQGVPVLVDPGTFCYDSHPAWRRYLRSSAAHNCLVVDEADQAEYWGPFLWGTAPSARVVRYEPTALEPLAAVTHDGYASAGYTTLRTVSLTDTAITVTDQLNLATDGSSDHRSPIKTAITLTLPQDAEVVRNQSEVGSTSAATVHVGGRTVELTTAEGWSLEVLHGHCSGAGWYSPSFGVISPTHALVLRGHMVMGQPSAFTLRWA